MRKKFVGITIDDDSQRLLQVMADNENEGNVSCMVRDLVRQAAKARGLTENADEHAKETAQG